MQWSLIKNEEGVYLFLQFHLTTLLRIFRRKKIFLCATSELLKFSFWAPGKQGIKSYLCLLAPSKRASNPWSISRNGKAQMGRWQSRWPLAKPLGTWSSCNCKKKCQQLGPSASEGSTPDQVGYKGSTDHQGATTVALQPCHLTGRETEVN